MNLKDFDIPKEAFIYAAIHILSNRMQILGDRVDPTVSSKQWFLLAAVSKFENKPPNIGDIADILGTSRQNVKKMADILERRGFLKLEKSHDDKRSTQLVLTKQCWEYFKSRENQEDRYIDGIYQNMDEVILESLCEGLDQMIKNMDILLEKR